MKNYVLFGSIIGLIGIIFLAGGIGASLNVATTNVRCEVCGMTVSKTDISTIQVVTADGVTHWACSPACAAEEAIYYVNATINAHCYISGRAITIAVVNGNVSSVSVSPPSTDDKVMVVNGGTMDNTKFVSTQAYANQLVQTFASENLNASIKPLSMVFSMAKTKLSQSTLSYKPVVVPTINYALMGIGASFLIASPLSWKLLKNRSKT